MPQLGPRIPVRTLRRFWTTRKSWARSRSTAKQSRYLDLMIDVLLVRRLPPLRANVGKRLTKSRKPFVRDGGLVHALLRLWRTGRYPKSEGTEAIGLRELAMALIGRGAGSA